MRAVINPSIVKGGITAPPSKSMAHRLIIAAGLSDGSSLVQNVAMSEDIKATANCMRALGAKIEAESAPESSASFGYGALRINGIDPRKTEAAEMDCNECGSTLRFLIPVAALSTHEMILKGSETLMKRPLGPYEDIFERQDLKFDKSDREIRIRGRIEGGEFDIPGDISSQFASGLLMTLPLTTKDSRIRLTGNIESRPYIDMTISALKSYGIEACWQDANTLCIKGNQKYNASDKAVEGDWSNAAYLEAAGALVSGLDDNSLQGDKVYKTHFDLLRRGHADINIEDCPDLGPVLMAYAAMNHGCTLHGTERLKIKESDRGKAMAEELSKLGVHAEIEDNAIKVGCGLKAPTQPLYGHNDHRIVMALTAPLLRCGGIIEGAEAVSKSYPDFFEKIKEAGADVSISN